MKFAVLTCAALFTLLDSGVSESSVPRLITHQGRLTTPSGQPVPDGSYLIRFVIYGAPTGGAALWDNDYRTVLVTNGLFTYPLGDSTPLPPSLFDSDTSRYLGVKVGVDPEMSPRIKLGTVPYSAKAQFSDSSRHAQTIADNSVTGPKIQSGSIEFADIGANGALPGQVPKWNGSSWTADSDQTGEASGWVDNATVVSLKNTSDSVGIGTTTPGRKLDVVGSIRASDSIFAAVSEVGSPATHGEFNIYRSGSSTPIISAFPDAQGAILDLYDENGGYTHSLKADFNGSGGSLAVMSNWPSGNGFSVDGNYDGTGNPRVTVTGTAATTVFDMSATDNNSVVLPSGSISASEILDEPGIASNNNSSSITLNTSAMQDLATVTITIPSSGYVLVHGQCRGFISGTTGTNLGIIQIDESSGGGPFATGSVYATYGSMAAPNTSIMHFPVSIMRIYAKSAGTYTFRIEGAAYSANNAAAVTQASNSNLIATFFSTSYGSVMSAVPATEAGDFEGTEPEQATGETMLRIASSDPLFRVDLRELEVRAAKARAEANRAEANLVRAQLLSQSKRNK